MKNLELLYNTIVLPFSEDMWDSGSGPLSYETMEKYGLEEWDNGYDLGNDPDGPMGLYQSPDGRRWMAFGGRTPDGEVVNLHKYDEDYYLELTGKTLAERLDY